MNVPIHDIAENDKILRMKTWVFECFETLTPQFLVKAETEEEAFQKGIRKVRKDWIEEAFENDGKNLRGMFEEFKKVPLGIIFELKDEVKGNYMNAVGHLIHTPFDPKFPFQGTIIKLDDKYKLYQQINPCEALIKYLMKDRQPWFILWCDSQTKKKYVSPPTFAQLKRLFEIYQEGVVDEIHACCRCENPGTICHVCDCP